MTIRPTPGDAEFSTEPPRDEPAQIAGFATREEMIRQAIHIMRLRGEGRFTELAALATDDCEVVFPGLPGQSPFNGSHKGKEASFAAMKANFTLIEFVNLEARSALADGDTVVLDWTCKMRNRGSGPMVPVQGLARIRFRNRKVCFYSNHLDTAAIADLA